jgi:hypothetical protein
MDSASDIDIRRHVFRQVIGLSRRHNREICRMKSLADQTSGRSTARANHLNTANFANFAMNFG